MILFRWLATFLSFPVAGALAILVLGGADNPVIAGLGGLVVGAGVGLAQWLALRSHGFGPSWVLGTTLGMALGSAVAVAVTNASTSIPALVVTGLVTGVVVGVIQGVQLSRGRIVAAAWAVVVSLSWGLGWFVTANVIVDAEKGFYAFGSSGALVATLVSGLALHLVLRSPTTEIAPVVTAPVGARS